MSTDPRYRAQIASCAQIFQQEHEHGRAFAQIWAIGFLSGSAGYIEKKDGAIAAYEFVQRLADEIAERIPARDLRVQRRRA